MTDNDIKPGDESVLATVGTIAASAAISAAVKAFMGNNPTDGASVGFGTFVDACMAVIASRDVNIDPTKDVSLSNFTKSTQISSSVYIQKELAQEEILGDVLNCAQQLYISWVLAAVNLSKVIEGTKTTIKDALKVVATEKLLNELNQIYVPTSDILSGLESYGAFTKSGHDTPKVNLARGTEASIGNARIIKDHGPLNETKLPVGRVVELTFGPNAKVNAMVNLYPQFIPIEIMREFFRLGRTRPLAERWFKYRIGEISFWSFMFDLFSREEKRAALKKDTTGVLAPLLAKQRSAFADWIFKTTARFHNFIGGRIDTRGDEKRQNMANSVLVYNKADFARWCKELHQDFKQVNVRNEFMFKTMSMMIIIIDPDYQMVEMYYHGIQNKGEFTYKQIQNQAKSEKTDIMTLMQAFSNTHTPRF